MLVQCSLNGEDPYWGRIVSESGSAGVAFDIDRVVGGLRRHRGVRRRRGSRRTTAQPSTAHMAGRHIELVVRPPLGGRLGRRLGHRPGLWLHRREPDHLVTTPNEISLEGAPLVSPGPKRRRPRTRPPSWWRHCHTSDASGARSSWSSTAAMPSTARPRAVPTTRWPRSPRTWC